MKTGMQVVDISSDKVGLLVRTRAMKTGSWYHVHSDELAPHQQRRLKRLLEGGGTSMSADTSELGKLVWLRVRINDTAWGNLKAALNCSVLRRVFPVGSRVGFKVGRKHFVITRDE